MWRLHLTPSKPTVNMAELGLAVNASVGFYLPQLGLLEPQEVDDVADASGEAEDEEADDILAQLVELFKAENGREPTEEEVQQWMQTLKEAAEEGGLAI